MLERAGEPVPSYFARGLFEMRLKLHKSLIDRSTADIRQYGSVREVGHCDRKSQI